MEDKKTRKRKKRPEDLEKEIEAIMKYLKDDPNYAPAVRHFERAMVNVQIAHQRMPANG